MAQLIENAADCMVVVEKETGEKHRVELMDAVARERIGNIRKIVSPVPIEPHKIFGGTWEYQDYHNFRGEYVYVWITPNVE